MHGTSDYLHKADKISEKIVLWPSCELLEQFTNGQKASFFANL